MVDGGCVSSACALNRKRRAVLSIYDLPFTALLRRTGRGVRQGDAVHGLPVFGRDHLDCVPGAAVEERAVGAFADALLAADAEVRVNLDATEGRVLVVGHPEHAGLDGTIFDAGGRARAARAAVGRDRQQARLLLARRLAVALGHRPMFLDDFDHESSAKESLYQ